MIALRILVLVLVGVLILLPAGPGAHVVEVTGSEADLSQRNTDVRAFVRRSSSPPSPLELDLLAALSGEAPLFGVRPALPPPLLARAPLSAVAGRNAAVDWQLSGSAGTTVAIRISDLGGPLDSAIVSLDSAGRAAGAFRVRPGQPGWQAWAVEAAGARVEAGAWVGPADTVRALVLPGTAPLEGREVARALERGGLDVQLAPALGRGLRLGDAPAGVPESADAMAAWDVIVVLAGVHLGAIQVGALEEYLQSGGGLLVAGRAAGAFPFVAIGDRQNIDAAGIAWSAPAEVEPLPAIAASIPSVWLRMSSPAAASSGDRALMALGGRGRGRWAVLGLEETWRWSLEAGRSSELSRFWVSLTDWLAGGAHGTIALSVEPGTAPPGVPVDVHLNVLDLTVPRPDSVVLARPGGELEKLPLAWTAERGVARFIAQEPGDHAVLLPGQVIRAGHHADPEAGPGHDAWARLALIADRSGGALVSADSIDVIVRQSASAVSWLRSRTLLTVLIITLAFAEWMMRRLRGHA